MLFLLTIFACGHAGDDYVPKSVEGYEGVSVLGELTPMSRDNLLSTTARQEGVTYATLSTKLR